ncbi:MAG: hypothetical protein U1D30_20910 [Planctomycetota bacterium]
MGTATLEAKANAKRRQPGSKGHWFLWLHATIPAASRSSLYTDMEAHADVRILVFPMYFYLLTHPTPSSTLQKNRAEFTQDEEPHQVG